MSLHSKLDSIGTSIHQWITAFMDSPVVDAKLDQLNKRIQSSTKDLHDKANRSS